MQNLTGQMLGKVRVDMFLARGGMADVFVGTHTTLNRAVAIKFLKGDLQDEPDLRERFEREAQVIARLRHPNIVQVYDFDTFENRPYLVMEYVPGTSLSTYLRELHKNSQRLNISQITNLLSKLAAALKYAHDNDVIHRDIKPANILLTSRTTPVEAGKPLPEDTEPIITDFGLVRLTQSNKQTSTGVITGTPAYMSPEQARGDRVDTRTDVYSLAATVYEMLAGRTPFDADSTLSLLHMQIYDPPPPIEGISEELQTVMTRALAKSPADRFSTSIEFAEAFQNALSGVATSPATQSISPTPSQASTLARMTAADGTSAPKRLNPLFLWGGLGALVIVAGLVMFPRVSNPASEPPPNINTHTQQVEIPSPVTTDTPAAIESATEIPTNVAPSPDLLGLLRFQDGTSHADQATLTIAGIAPPPEGSQYEAWLIQDDDEQRVSLGVIEFDQNNRATLSHVDNQGRNLIGLYHALEITIEPKDNNPINSNNIAFSAVLPRSSFAHVRHVLFSFGGNPGGKGFIYGLDEDSILLNEIAGDMLASFETGDEAGVRSEAEKMVNIIVGNQDRDHKDWNNDGTKDDPSDGFGLLLNGDNEGYIQGTLSHAGLAASAQDATENMVVHSEHVINSVNNVSEWTPQLRDLLITILNAPASTDLEGTIRDAVALANKIRNGVDVNGNENIEAIPGEGGAVTAYQHAFYMADINLFPSLVSQNQDNPAPASNATSQDPAGYN